MMTPASGSSSMIALISVISCSQDPTGGSHSGADEVLPLVSDLRARPFFAAGAGDSEAEAARLPLDFTAEVEVFFAEDFPAG